MLLYYIQRGHRSKGTTNTSNKPPQNLKILLVTFFHNKSSNVVLQIYTYLINNLIWIFLSKQKKFKFCYVKNVILGIKLLRDSGNELDGVGWGNGSGNGTGRFVSFVIILFRKCLIPKNFARHPLSWPEFCAHHKILKKITKTDT